MEYTIKRKERNIISYGTMISLPKIFLALPFFNTKRSGNQYNELTIKKFQNLNNIELKAENLSIFNDFEYFLFIYKEMIRTRSKTVEFNNNDMLDKLQVAKNHRTTYYKDYVASVKKMASTNFSYEEEKASKGFSFFASRKITREKSSFVFTDEFVEFFNNIPELYEIDFRILAKLKNEHQRILYVMYVCNRKGEVNYFSVDMLKKRFLVSDKIPDKTFIYKIRQANIALEKLTLIEGFEEEKEVSTVKGKKVVGRVTEKFKVKYSYESLYMKKKKEEKKEEKKTDFSAFDDEENKFIN